MFCLLLLPVWISNAFSSPRLLHFCAHNFLKPYLNYYSCFWYFSFGTWAGAMGGNFCIVFDIKGFFSKNLDLKVTLYSFTVNSITATLSNTFVYIFAFFSTAWNKLHRPSMNVVTFETVLHRENAGDFVSALFIIMSSNVF